MGIVFRRNSLTKAGIVIVNKMCILVLPMYLCLIMAGSWYCCTSDNCDRLSVTDKFEGARELRVSFYFQERKRGHQSVDEIMTGQIELKSFHLAKHGETGLAIQYLLRLPCTFTSRWTEIRNVSAHRVTPLASDAKMHTGFVMEAVRAGDASSAGGRSFVNQHHKKRKYQRVSSNDLSLW